MDRTFVERSQNAHVVLVQETLLPVLYSTVHNACQTDIKGYIQDNDRMLKQ